MEYHVDGDLVPADEASVSVRDRGFMYGDAAFETLRAYGGDPFAWAAHRERLQHTAETLGFGDHVPDDLR
jgi:branched-chain amino acid aminotransferase